MNPYEFQAQFGGYSPSPQDPTAAPPPQPAPQAGIPGLTPDVLQQLIALGGLDDQSSQLDEQMALANQLRQGDGRSYHTGLGGAFGAAGDALRGYQAHQIMDDVKTQRGQITDQRTAGRMELAKLLG